MDILGKIKTVESYPLIAVPDLDSLILSDLHVGIEIVQTSSGVLMPRFQTDNILEELGEARKISGMSNLVINGDLKHSFSGKNKKENQEVEMFLRKVSMLFEKVYVVRGNHDSAIKYRAADFNNVEVMEKIEKDGFLIVHGHKKIEANEETHYIIIGHEHPALELKDDAGVTEKVSCLLYGQKEGVFTVVLPAYSEIASGTSINNIPKNRLLSPHLRDIGVKHMEAVCIDRDAGVLKFPRIEKLK